MRIARPTRVSRSLALLPADMKSAAPSLRLAVLPTGDTLRKRGVRRQSADAGTQSTVASCRHSALRTSHFALLLLVLAGVPAGAERFALTNGPQPLWQHVAFVPLAGDALAGASALREAGAPVVWQRVEGGVLVLLNGVTAPGAVRTLTTHREPAAATDTTDLTVRETATGIAIANSYFGVVHPKACNGVFPTSIRFSQSGSEEKQFVFEDRLYEKDRGSCAWRGDAGASARVVEKGPLQVVVEARARAANVAGNPRATYRYRYRACLPVVEVTARIERDDDFVWSELHFLQISRKDSVFSRWAGGDPVRAGTFTDARRGEGLNRWAMMANDQDAIAMAINGNISLYDGISEYYNYIQQVEPFRARTANYSARVYLGPARPAEQIRDCLLREPAVSVRPVQAAPAPDRGTPAAQAVTLDSGKIALGFAKPDDGMGLTSLFSRVTRREFLTPPAGKPLIWRLVLRGPQTDEVRVENTAPARCTWAPRPAGTGKAMELTWAGIALPGEAAALTVRVRVEVPAAGETSLWRINVENRSKRLGLWEVHFPLFAGLSESGLPDVAVPRSNWGTLTRGARSPIGGSYPSADWPMQFLLVNQGQHGLSLAAHDPGAQPKRFFFAPGGEFYFSTYAENMGVPGSSFHAPFPVAVGVYKGDWWQGAKRYRAWALRQPWTARGPLATRKDTPQAMKDLGLWMLLSGKREEVVPKMEQARKLFGVPMGVHWYSWHQIPFDVHYPDYFPTKPGFADGVRALTRAGDIAMPYINGRLWDVANDNFAAGRPGAAKQAEGAPYIETYGSGAKLAPMCPTTKVWQDKMNEVVGRLIKECGVNAIYLDQIGAAGPALCFDKAHGHPLGGGRHWVDGYRRLLNRVRAQTAGRVGITTENNAEPYMDNVDGFLIWNPRGDTEIPLMTAVYSGYTLYFSSPAYSMNPEAFRMTQGRDFLWGCQQGWMGAELLDPTHRANAEYLRRLARQRLAAKEFLVYGELLGEVRPTAAPDVQEATWGGWRGSTKPAALPAVLGTVWRSRDGRGAMALANLSDTPQRFAFRFEPSAWGLSKGIRPMGSIRPIPPPTWALFRVAPDSKRTPVAVLAEGAGRVESLGPAEVLVLEAAPVAGAQAQALLAQLRRAALRPQAMATPAETLATVEFLGKPRAGEACALRVRVRAGDRPAETVRLTLDAPAAWNVEPGRALTLEGLKAGETRALLFRCDVPAGATGEALVRANVVLPQQGRRAPVLPARPAMDARRLTPAVDGNLDEWRAAPALVLDQPAHSKVKEWKGPADVSARVWTAWDDRCFYFAAEVADSAFEQTQRDRGMWQGDCIQLALRPGPPTDAPAYDDVQEFGLALTPAGPEIWKWMPEERVAASGRLEVRRTDGGLVYEAAIPWSEMGDMAPAAGSSIGFSLTVNDADGTGFRGWLEWTPGVCGTKDASAFGRLRFVP